MGGPGSLLEQVSERLKYFDRDTLIAVKGSYNFTRAGLRNAEQHGIAPRELWEIIGSKNRVFVPVGDRSRFVAGQTLSGRWLGFLAQESEHEQDVWDIVAARELNDREIKNVRQVRGDRDA